MFKIWRSGQTEALEQVADSTYELQSWVPYIVRTDQQCNFPRNLASTRPPGTDCPYEYDLNFQDYVGIRRIGDISLRVTSPKLDEHGFDRLLADLTAASASLPFDYQTPTFIPHERVSIQSEDVLYHVFAYLRWAVFDAEYSLPDLLASIGSDPIRMLVSSHRETTLDRARRIGPREIDRLASTRKAWRAVTPDHPLAHTALASRTASLTGVTALPQNVDETHRYDTVDTPENRFVRYCLDWLVEITERIRRFFIRREVDDVLLDDAIALEMEIHRLRQAPWLEEVGEMRTFPANSQVLQRKRGYRELLGHYLSLIMASRYPIASDDLRRILETKSASTLYEYWVFFTIVDSVRRCLKRSPTRAFVSKGIDDLRVVVQQGITIDFGPDIQVLYNRRVPGNNAAGRYKSYSLALRPDVLLRVGKDIYAFDAKFRVERDKYWAAKTPEEKDEVESLADDIEGSREDGIAKWFKQSDIHKMHTYKDAMRNTAGDQIRSAWAVYPGTEFRFYSDEGGKIMIADLPCLPVGVGAVPLEPNGSREALDSVLHKMLIPRQCTL